MSSSGWNCGVSTLITNTQKPTGIADVYSKFRPVKRVSPLKHQPETLENNESDDQKAEYQKGGDPDPGPQPEELGPRAVASMGVRVTLAWLSSVEPSAAAVCSLLSPRCRGGRSCPPPECGSCFHSAPGGGGDVSPRTEPADLGACMQAFHLGFC